MSLEEKNRWKCQGCTSSTPRDNKNNTPIRPPHSGKESGDEPLAETINTIPTTSGSTVLNNVLLDQIGNLLDAKLDAKLGVMQQKLDAAFEQQKNDFTHTTDFLSAQLIEMKEEIRCITTRLNILETENHNLKSELMLIKSKDASADVVALLETVTNLQVESNEREQATLLNDVELCGIPEFAGESVMHILSMSATKLGVAIDENDVVSAVRVGSRRRQTETKDGTLPRPRPITVRLARRALRDELIKSSRVRRGIDTADIGLPNHNPVPFYVNERLTKLNRKILAKAREAGRAGNWKFVWTKEGRIYAKLLDTPSSPAHLLKSEKDILRVFGNGPLSQTAL